MTASCRETCLRAGEPLGGSAGGAHALVLLRWPKPRWHPEDKARSEGLPGGLAALVAREAEAGRKLALRLFQRDAQPPLDRVELFALRPDERALFRADAGIDEVVPRLRRWLGGDAAALEPCDARVVLVCTDGRHDRCCAEHGRPVLEALRASAPLDWQVLESSHIGGHRFAANCLVLPSGRTYGRLAPQDVAPLAAALADDRVYAPRYRGRFGLGEPAQAAEAFLHARFPEARSVEPGAEHEDAGLLRLSARVHLERGDHDVVVSLARRRFTVPDACGEPAAERERWVPTGLLD